MIFPKEAKDRIEALQRWQLDFFIDGIKEDPNGKYLVREDVMKILREMKA